MSVRLIVPGRRGRRPARAADRPRYTLRSSPPSQQEQPAADLQIRISRMTRAAQAHFAVDAKYVTLPTAACCRKFAAFGRVLCPGKRRLDRSRR